MEVIGFGDPVLDVISHVSYETLSSLGFHPGGCDVCSKEEMERLLAIPEIKQGLSRHPGGSAANVCKGLACLDPNHPISFIGMIGNDTAGTDYKTGLSACGVTPLLCLSTSDAATASCLCLITPDGQRTMRTYLGAALELKSADQLPSQITNNANLALLHFEGYSLYRAQVTLAAMQAAKVSASTKVSLDLASFEVIRHCWGTLQSLLQQKLVDVLFCNEDEALAVCQLINGSNGVVSSTETSENGAAATMDDEDQVIETVLAYFLQYCSIVVISRGKKGCIVGNSQGLRASSTAACVDVVDTVGAGDHFTAGFLHAWLSGASLQAAAAVACASGTAVVQCVGANIDNEGRKRLSTKVEEILRSSSII